MNRNQTINVIGGGFSGLVQAFYLIEQGFSVCIYEKSNRLGGLLATEKVENFLVERAANALMANQEIERISDCIGSKLVGTKEASRKRYIYRDGQMCRWPLSFKGTLQMTPLLWQKIRKKDFDFKPGENLADWEHRMLGQEAAQYLLEPATQGVFAAPSDKLDAELVIRSMFTKYSKGVLKGSVAPEWGMGDWIDKMVSYLQDNGCKFEMETEALPDGPLVFAISLTHLKELYREKKIELPKSIEYTQCTSLTSCVLMYREDQNTPEGFGCLFPNDQDFHSIGVLFNQHIFANRAPKGVSETWILNDFKQDVSQMSEALVRDLVLQDREKLFGQSKEPDFLFLNQWPDRIPLYNKELKTFIEDVDVMKTPHLFSGHSYGQLGLSKLVFRAKDNAIKIAGGHFA